MQQNTYSQRLGVFYNKTDLSFFGRFRKLIILFFLLLLIFLFFLFSFYILKSKPEVIYIESNFEIKNLQGVSRLAEEPFIFLLFQKKNYEKFIRDSNPFIKKASLSFHPLNKIKLSIQSYQLVAWVVQEDFSLGLSEDGRILKKAAIPESRPYIFFYQKIPRGIFKTGSWLDFKEIILVLDSIRYLRKANFLVDEVVIESNKIIFKKNDQQIIISNKMDPINLHDNFRKIYKFFKIQGKEFILIDFRFEKPVIKLRR